MSSDIVAEQSSFFHENSIDSTEMMQVILEQYSTNKISSQTLDKIIPTFFSSTEVEKALIKIAQSKNLNSGVRLLAINFVEDSSEIVNSVLELAFFEENKEISDLLKIISQSRSKLQSENIDYYLKQFDKNPTIQQKLRIIEIFYVLYDTSHYKGSDIFEYQKSNSDNLHRLDLIKGFMLEATSPDVRITATRCICSMYNTLDFKSMKSDFFEVVFEAIKEALASNNGDQIIKALHSLSDLKRFLPQKIPNVIQTFKDIVANDELPVTTRLNGLDVLRMYFDERFIDISFFKVIFQLLKQLISSLEYNGEFVSALFPEKKFAGAERFHNFIKHYFELIQKFLAREKNSYQIIIDLVDDQNSHSICAAFFCFSFFNSNTFAHDCIYFITQNLDKSDYLMREIALLNLTKIFRFSLRKNTTNEFFDYIPLWVSCISDINSSLIETQLLILEDVIVRMGDLLEAKAHILIETILPLFYSKKQKIRMRALSFINRIRSIAGFGFREYSDPFFEKVFPQLQIDSRELADFQIGCGEALAQIMKMCCLNKIQELFSSIEDLAFECLNHWNYKRMRLGLILLEGLYCCSLKISKTKLQNLLVVLQERVNEYHFQKKEKIDSIIDEISYEDDINDYKRQLHERELSDFYALNTNAVSLYAALAKGFKYDFFKIHELTTIIYPVKLYFRGLEVEKNLTSLMKIIIGVIKVTKIPKSKLCGEEKKNFKCLKLLVQNLFLGMGVTFPYCDLEFYDMFLKCLSKISIHFLNVVSKEIIPEIAKMALQFEFVGIGESVLCNSKNAKDLPITTCMAEKLFSMFLHMSKMVKVYDKSEFGNLLYIFIEKYNDDDPNIRYLVLHFAKKIALLDSSLMGFEEIAMAGIIDEDINIISESSLLISTPSVVFLDPKIAIEAMLKAIAKDNICSAEICGSLCKMLQRGVFITWAGLESFVEALLNTVLNQQRLVFNVDLLNFLCYLLDDGVRVPTWVEKIFRIFEIAIEPPAFNTKICRKIAFTVSGAVKKNKVHEIQKHSAKIMAHMNDYASVLQKNAKVAVFQF